jgi:hypothetical protein
MTAWVLVVLGANLAALPISTVHTTRAACEQQLAVEVVHLVATRRPPADAFCQAVRVPALAPVVLP